MTTQNLEQLRPTYDMMIQDGFDGIDSFYNYLYDIDGIQIHSYDEEDLMEHFNL